MYDKIHKKKNNNNNLIKKVKVKKKKKTTEDLRILQGPFGPSPGDVEKQ